MLSLECVMEGSNSTNLKMVIVQAFLNNDGMQNFDVFSKRYLSFGVEGITILQGCHTSITNPNSSLVCFVYDWCPLYGTLNKLGYPNPFSFAHCQSFYNHYSNFLNKHLEPTKIVKILEITLKSLKILNNVKTR